MRVEFKYYVAGKETAPEVIDELTTSGKATIITGKNKEPLARVTDYFEIKDGAIYRGDPLLINVLKAIERRLEDTVIVHRFIKPSDDPNVHIFDMHQGAEIYGWIQ